MHVPKSAGTSVRDMLEAALPSGSLAHRRTEPSTFCGFGDFDRLTTEAREEIAVTESEIQGLAEHPAICGHFSLQTLERLAPRANIATVLREPRSRLISHYLFLRFQTGLRTKWGAYGIHTAAEGTLSEFLDDLRVATASDNKTCRMLLHGDARIRDGRFIDAGEVESVAEAAWERLNDLGFAGVLELPDEAWRGVGELFGVELRPARRNVAGAEEIQPGMLPVPPLGGTAALELLARRSAADAILHRRVASRFAGGEEQARSLAESAFAEQLVRYGAFTSDAVAELENERRAHSRAREQLQARCEDLARSSATLETLTRSRSRRLTAPLRRVRRALRRPPGAATERDTARRMSQENVELVRRWLDGVSRGELSLELCDPEIQIENIAEFPITGPYRGHDGVRRWWEDIAEAFSEVRFELEELIDVEDGRVLSTQRMVGRFRNTDIPVDTPWASLISVRDGSIARAVGFASRRQALEAAGLSE